MQVKLNDKMRRELTDILELHKGYFGAEVEHLVNAVNGVRYNKYIDKEVRDILAKVEDATGVAYNIMASKTRERNYVIARQYAIYQVYQQLHHLGYTLMEIGKLFNRDHATVLYSIKQIQSGIRYNDFLITKIHERYGKLEAEIA
jgi:chromosomal replication initiation ATPase DnaA